MKLTPWKSSCRAACVVEHHLVSHIRTPFTCAHRVLSIRYFRLVSSDDVLTAWVAIDDADSENGALRYIVGAHVEGIVPHAISNHAEPYNINANLSAGYLQAADEVRPTS